MLFRKALSLLLFLNVVSCGLHVGETPYHEVDELDYSNFEQAEETCSSFPYKKTIKHLLLTNQDPRLFKEDIRNVMLCLRTKLYETGNLIRGETEDFLTKQELYNFLQSDLLQEGEVGESLNEINSSKDKFENLIYLKQVILATMDQFEVRDQLAHPSVLTNICLQQPNQEALRKSEIQKLVNFLGSAQAWIALMSGQSEIIYNGLQRYFNSDSINLYFEKNYPNRSPYRVIRSIIDDTREEFLEPFAPFLSDQQIADDERLNLYESFKVNQKTALSLPLLRQEILSSIFASKLSQALPHFSKFTSEGLNNSLRRDAVEEMLTYIYAMINVRKEKSYSDEISLLDVQYMLFNIHIVDIFIRAYDTNKDFILERSEMQGLACIFSSLAKLFVEDDDLNWLEKYMMYPDRVFNYTMKYQKVPGQHFHYFIMAHFAGDNFSLSRSDLSKLVYVLTNAFFPRDYLESDDEK